MAKTDFTNPANPILNSTFCNTLYNTGGGHKHDGADNDGHSSKIDLNKANHVSGRLPWLNTGILGNFKSGLKMEYAQVGDSWSITFNQGLASSRNTITADGYQFRPFIQLTAASLNKIVINSTGDGWEQWVAGDGAGGVPTQAAGWAQAIGDNVWLHCFILGKEADNTAIDFGFDSSLTAANLRALANGWDIYRRVGSIKIESLGGGKYGIKKFKQQGDRFVWSGQHAADYSGTPAAGGVHTTVTVNVPPGIYSIGLIHAVLNLGGVGEAAAGIVYPYDCDNITTINWPWMNLYADDTHGTDHCEEQIIVDASQRIKLSTNSGASGSIASVVAMGWIELFDNGL